MKITLSIAALFFFCGLAVPGYSQPLNIQTVDTVFYLVSGADPFFWANVPIAINADADAGTTPTSCGPECASYTLSDLTLAVDGTNIYPAAAPELTINYDASGDSTYELTGLISVASTYVVQIDLDLGLPEGTLDATSLNDLPEFPATSIDTLNSDFTYGIVAGGPSLSGTFALQDGTVAAAVVTPEPVSSLLVLSGLGFFATAWYYKKSTGLCVPPGR